MNLITSFEDDQCRNMQGCQKRFQKWPFWTSILTQGSPIWPKPFFGTSCQFDQFGHTGIGTNLWQCVQEFVLFH